MCTTTLYTSTSAAVPQPHTSKVMVQTFAPEEIWACQGKCHQSPEHANALQNRNKIAPAKMVVQPMGGHGNF